MLRILLLLVIGIVGYGGFSVYQRQRQRLDLRAPKKSVEIMRRDGKYQIHYDGQGRVVYREFQPAQYISQDPIEGVEGPPPIAV